MDELRAEWGDADPPPMKAGAPILGILPGSRRQEVSAALPHMIRAAHRIREEEPRLRILASYSQPGLRSMIGDWVKATVDTGVGDPRGASAEKGQAFLEDLTQKIAGYLVDLAKSDISDLYE